MPTTPRHLPPTARSFAVTAFCAAAVGLGALVFASRADAQTASPLIALQVDATDAPRFRFRVTETIPAKPGHLELVYPKWIPGEHRPSGPISNVVDLHVFAGGQEIPWRRDLDDMYVIGFDVPSGASSVEVRFEDAESIGDVATPNLARVKWNRLIMYPRGMRSDAVTVQATLRLPEGWKYGTALPPSPLKRLTDEATSGYAPFGPVNLTTLIDSPVLAGRNFRVVTLPTVAGRTHEIDFAAESPETLDTMGPETVAGMGNLVREADALFGGAHHYKGYHWLFSASSDGGSEGLEHHESSEDGVGANEFLTPGGRTSFGDLMSHEYFHSWNGKFRRPAGLATPDFLPPMHGDLLWVYEGLTQYYGNVLPARSHLFTPQAFQDILARSAADLSLGTGRQWRSVGDTATSVQLTYRSPRVWRSSRRGSDYYVEGMLVWLEVDAIIRQQSGGRKSLDDFCRLFHGNVTVSNAGEQLVPYERKDVVDALKRVQPYEWDGFFQSRIDAVSPPPPTRGIVAAGWRLIYNDVPPGAGSESREPDAPAGGGGGGLLAPGTATPAGAAPPTAGAANDAAPPPANGGIDTPPVAGGGGANRRGNANGADGGFVGGGGRRAGGAPVSFTRSLGFSLGPDGSVSDLVEGSPADLAGIALGAQITTVNGERYGRGVLEAAIKAAEPGGAAAGKPLALAVRRNPTPTVSIAYTGGLRYPHLERDLTKPDLLTPIITALTKAPPEAATGAKP